MSTERDKLAKIMDEWLDDEAPLNLRRYIPVADSILAAGYRKPRTVTKPEELESLHESAILRSRGGDAFQRGEDFHQRKGWFMNGTVDPLTTQQIVAFGPFTVIHEPS